jgi:hypothetical protein
VRAIAAATRDVYVFSKTGGNKRKRRPRGKLAGHEGWLRERFLQDRFELPLLAVEKFAIGLLYLRQHRLDNN